MEKQIVEFLPIMLNFRLVMTFYKFLADAVVVIHLAFIIFVVLGGLLVYKYRLFAWIHLPAVFWGAYVEFTGRICPLTPLENRLRVAAGLTGYGGGFVDEYLMPVIYPSGLTEATQIILGIMVVIINLIIYGSFFVTQKKESKHRE